MMVRKKHDPAPGPAAEEKSKPAPPTDPYEKRRLLAEEIGGLYSSLGQVQKRLDYFRTELDTASQKLRGERAAASKELRQVLEGFRLDSESASAELKATIKHYREQAERALTRADEKIDPVIADASKYFAQLSVLGDEVRHLKGEVDILRSRINETAKKESTEARFTTHTLRMEEIEKRQKDEAREFAAADADLLAQNAALRRRVEALEVLVHKYAMDRRASDLQPSLVPKRQEPPKY